MAQNACAYVVFVQCTVVGCLVVVQLLKHGDRHRLVQRFENVVPDGGAQARRRSVLALNSVLVVVQSKIGVTRVVEGQPVSRSRRMPSGSSGITGTISCGSNTDDRTGKT